jgi:hypothetical protein
MATDEVAAARHALMTSAKLLEALAASPNQDEDVNLYAVECFDRAALHYVQRFGRERAEDLLADGPPPESRPRYEAFQGARASVETKPPRNDR